MSKAQLVITALVLESRSKSAVAREYDLRYWVQQLVKRYKTEGAAASEDTAVTGGAVTMRSS